MISVIIPFYNDEKYVKECLDSVQRQTYKNFECICIDDGSTDKTLSILKEFSENDKRFMVYQNYHKGPGYQRNFGIKKANGEYIIFMDHDDWVESSWLEKLLFTLVEGNADVAYCSNAEYYQDTGEYKNYYFSKKELQLAKIKLNGKNKGSCLTYKYFAPWRRLVRKNLLIDNNIRFAEGDFKFDDVLFTQELIENIESVAFCNEILYYHRIFDLSITKKSEKNHDMFLEHLDTVEKVIEYAMMNKRDPKLMLSRMIPLLLSYFKYVESYKDFYKRLKKIYSNLNMSPILIFNLRISYLLISVKRKMKSGVFYK